MLEAIDSNNIECEFQKTVFHEPRLKRDNTHVKRIKYYGTGFVIEEVYKNFAPILNEHNINTLMYSNELIHKWFFFAFIINNYYNDYRSS